MNEYRINLNADSSEKVDYDSPDFFSYVRKGTLSSYPNYTCLCHWHEDIELIYVLDGKISYRINDDLIELNKNEGLFVNSRQLHYGFSDTQRECVFICILLHPMLLCITRQIEERYVTPVTHNAAVPYIHLQDQVNWHKKINEQILFIYQNYDASIYPLQIQSAFYQLWIPLYQNMPQNLSATPPNSHSLSSMKQMIEYIGAHYSSKIKVEQLAKSAHISESMCFQLFHSYMGQSPMEYITRVRLEHGIALMKNPSKSLTDISEELGFSSLSYFSEQFKKYYQTTPRNYRKNIELYGSA